MKKLLCLVLLVAMPALGLTNLSDFQGGVQANAVMPFPEKLWETCNQSTDPDGCMLDGLAKNKVSAQAQAMMNYSHGAIKDFKKMGSVTVAHVILAPTSHTDAYYIINDNGDVIDVDDQSILPDIDITKASNYAALSQKLPNINLWPGNHQYPLENDLPAGITQLVFSYALLNGCGACELGGIAKVGFNFDSNGSFLGVQLMELEPPPVTENSSS